MAPGNFEILHAWKGVLGASDVPFHACIQYIHTLEKLDWDVNDEPDLICELYTAIGCFTHRVVTMVADKLKRQWFIC